MCVCVLLFVCLQLYVLVLLCALFQVPRGGSESFQLPPLTPSSHPPQANSPLSAPPTATPPLQAGIARLGPHARVTPFPLTSTPLQCTPPFSAAGIARLGLQARVTVVFAGVVALDCGSRTLALSNGAQLGYDLLLIASGLQEESVAAFTEADPEVGGGPGFGYDRI